MRTLAIFALGLIVGVGVIVACSDDSPPDADAAVECDCPAAESPWADRLVRRTDMKSIAAGTLSDGVAALCNEGELLIHGSCSAGGTMFLLDAGSDDMGPTQSSAWGCTYRNDDVNPHDATATVLCLLPPPE